MDANSRVTVAICTWNRCELLRVTLDGLRGLRVPDGFDWELLVVNNNCSDATDAVVASFSGRLPVRLVHERTPGQSYARNLALREARGEYLLWTDDDVLVDPNWMCVLVAAFARTQAEVVFGRSIPHWSGSQPEWYSPLHHGRFAIVDYGDRSFVVTSPATSFYGLNFGTRREALLRLGGFDESLGYRAEGGAGGEDTDLCRRCLAAGMTIVYVPEAVVQHIIPVARTTKEFYRSRLESALSRDYEQLRTSFPNVPWLAGLPRFMFRNAAADALGYLLSRGTGEQDKSFDYELKLRRFAGYFRVAAARRKTSTERGVAS